MVGLTDVMLSEGKEKKKEGRDKKKEVKGKKRFVNDAIGVKTWKLTGKPLCRAFFF